MNASAISVQQAKVLNNSIRDFLGWLSDKVTLKPIELYTVVFGRPTPEDWLMRVEQDSGRTTIRFNPYILTKCSFPYYEMVVLHECFHLFVQNLPNKVDAKGVKDDFGDVMMKLLDIEADYFTALYLKEKRNFSLVDFFHLYSEGSTVFADPHIRPPKLERFIGSVLSIAALYFEYPNRSTTESDLYLPTINSVYTDNSLHILIARKSHFMVHTIHATSEDFREMKKCYTNNGDYTAKYYVTQLIGFAAKALGHEVPPKMRKQIEELGKTVNVPRRRTPAPVKRMPQIVLVPPPTVQ